MTKVVNLDKIQTKREKVIVLNGKEHETRVFTVKEYIRHMKEAEKLSKMQEDDLESMGSGLDATVKILVDAFPTITKEEFEALTMEQMEAIMALVNDTNDEALEGLNEGEVEGKTN